MYHGTLKQDSRVPDSKLTTLFRWVLPLLVAAVLALSLLPAVNRLIPRSETPSPDQMAKLIEVQRLIREKYVEPVQEAELFDGALRGMVGTLDRECQYFNPSDLDDFEADIRGEFGGLGMVLSKDGAFIRVVTPLEGTPAFVAGILAGDEILEIDGKSTEKMTVTEAMRLIRGEVATEVVLMVRHAGEEPKRLKLKRALVKLKAVKNAHFADRTLKIGYVRITAFQEDMVELFDKEITGLMAQGMCALVVDVRFNGGGLLAEALELCDRFLVDGLLLTMLGREEKDNRTYEAKPEGTLPPFPLAVLVNGGSASASEIFAGAIKDRGRGLIVGERTYGKGSVQQTYTIPQDDSGVKLTIARYYTPSGRRIDRPHRPPVSYNEDAGRDSPETNTEEWGIVPDFEVRMSRKEMQYLQKTWADAEIVRPPGSIPNSGQPGEDGINFAKDTQLEKAVAELRLRLAK
jgi:carboxyl-terminal processing protease